MESLSLFVVGAVVAGIGILAFVPLEYCILLPFCSIMWLGESFHLGGRLPFAPHVVFFGVMLAKRLVRRRSGAFLEVILRNRPLLLFCLLFAGALFYGIASSADPKTMKEDASSILYFVAMYAVIASTPDLNMRRVITGVVIVSSLAAAKVIYLYVVPVDAQFGNDWQATVLAGNSALGSRIILYGADVYFVLAAAFPFSTLLIKPQIYKMLSALPLLTMMGIGMLLSLTRSNWIGFAAVIVTQMLVLCWRSAFTIGTHSKFLFGIGIIVAIVAALVASGDYSPVPRVSQRFAEGDSTGSLSLRSDETDALLESVGSSVLVGRGIGSRYADPMNNGTLTGFSHNGYLFLYLKMGLLGVLLYAGILTECFRRLWRACMASRELGDLSLHIGLLSAMVGLCVLSLTVNKNFDVSGALFGGLAVGFCHQARRNRTSERRSRLVRVRDFFRSRRAASMSIGPATYIRGMRRRGGRPE